MLSGLTFPSFAMVPGRRMTILSWQESIMRCWCPMCPLWAGIPMIRRARFINMVDEFYDRNVKLILSAEAPLLEIYSGGKLEFEFQRTSSRLPGDAEYGVSGDASQALMGLHYRGNLRVLVASVFMLVIYWSSG